MESLLGLVFVCFAWLTFLTVRERKRKTDIIRMKDNEKRHLGQIKELNNKLENLIHLINGKEKRKEDEAG